MNSGTGPVPQVAYSVLKEDLFFPCRRAQFFPGGPLDSEAVLCAEMSRLAYCRAEPSFDFDQTRVRSEVARAGFTVCAFVESQGTHGFVASRHDNQLAIVAFRGTDKDDYRDLAADANALLVPWNGAGRVHRGFRDALAEVRESAVQALQSIACRTLYTGHSLGAALATLLASLHNPAALYTFGSPLAGKRHVSWRGLYRGRRKLRSRGQTQPA